jgi:hypothetical protein
MSVHKLLDTNIKLVEAEFASLREVESYSLVTCWIPKEAVQHLVKGGEISNLYLDGRWTRTPH